MCIKFYVGRFIFSRFIISVRLEFFVWNFFWVPLGRIHLDAMPFRASLLTLKSHMITVPLTDWELKKLLFLDIFMANIKNRISVLKTKMKWKKKLNMCYLLYSKKSFGKVLICNGPYYWIDPVKSNAHWKLSIIPRLQL